MAGKVEVGAPVSLDWVAVRLDCWCICLCYVHFTPENPEDGKMYLLVLAHSGCPGQGPGSHKMVVVVVVVVVVAVVVRYKFEPWIIYYGITFNTSYSETTTTITTTTTTTVLWPLDFVRDYPGELVPER